MDLIFIVYIAGLLFSAFVIGAVLGAAFSDSFREAIIRRLKHGLSLSRAVCNPIIAPGAYPWNAEAVLNPAAAIVGGRTHLLYRAIGMDGVSRIGYASSPDGFVFDELLAYPAYVCQGPSKTPEAFRRYSPVIYPSGGSWGGCEDPRMVTIDGRIYVTFNHLDNWIMRVACISIAEEDFLAKRFYKWEGPYFISFGDRHKNWVLFPQKFNGKFAVLHSIIGPTRDKVRIEFVDDLKTMSERVFESPDPQQIPDEQVAWHVHTRSAGPPPLKTDRGWLLLYHAHDAHEGSRYKLGAMLLDLEDPTTVIARSVTPVLEPDAHYENNGKPGIVYAAGATIDKGTLRVYYGGADKVVCVASAPLEPFLNALVEGEEVRLEPAPLLVK